MKLVVSYILLSLPGAASIQIASSRLVYSNVLARPLEGDDESDVRPILAMPLTHCFSSECLVEINIASKGVLLIQRSFQHKGRRTIPLHGMQGLSSRAPT